MHDGPILGNQGISKYICKTSYNTIIEHENFPKLLDCLNLRHPNWQCYGHEGFDDMGQCCL